MAIVFILLLLSIKSPGQSSTADSIFFGGSWRSYRVFLPTGFTAAASLPLVFNFHGYGSNALEQELYTQFDAVADTGNFIVCYPQGLNNSWNIVGGLPDDVAFTDTLISVLRNAYNVDPLRVYATGLSNGGFFSNLLGCVLADRIAAIAPVAGTNVSFVQSACNSTRMIPVLYLHGTADSVVNYNGGPGYVSALQLLQLWATRDGCSGTTDTVNLPDVSSTDLCTAKLISWHNCDSSMRVMHYLIDGGGHTWPGTPYIIGITNEDFNASSEIWRFFNQYSLVNAVSDPEKNILSVYPDPFSDWFTVRNPDHEKITLELYSPEGRLLKSATSDSDKFTFQTDGLPDGIYFLKISGRTIRTIKLMRFSY